MRAEINFKYIDEIERTYHYKLTHPKRIVKVNDAVALQSALREAEASQDIVLVTMKYEASKLFDARLKTKAMHNAHHLVKLYYFDQPDEYTDEVKKNDTNTDTPQVALDFEFMHDKAHIIQQIQAIQHEIRLGNTYQVNYTTRLTAANHERNLYHVYQQLAHHHGRYTAYIEDDEETIVSISPELFFQYDLKSKSVLTKPMKGTMPTSTDAMRDKKNYEFLKQSTKDQAENVMIVDLLRNDLSKIAAQSSVRVPHLFTIERYASVYQMTSTITANIGEHGLYDIFKALFPCGSITGAPKQSTMSIIERLEDTPRSIYCGAIGIIVPNEVAIFNVPIRTMEYQHDSNAVVYGVGGGITIDSDAVLEYEEMVAKSNVLKYLDSPSNATGVSLPKDFHLIETMRLEAGQIQRKDYHQARLIKALNHFNIECDTTQLNQLFEQSFDHLDTPQMYRLTVSASGQIESAIRPMPTMIHQASLKRMQFNEQQFHQYKTSVRSQYASDGLTLFHDGAQVLEFNIGNLMIERDGQYITPAHPYILNGCMRQSLIDNGNLIEQAITLQSFIDDYVSGRLRIYMINSLREQVEIDLIIE
ncbi:bifunctional anthranilate synthase component I family protein/class IV aminotransferase [Macrococcus capreoli]